MRYPVLEQNLKGTRPVTTFWIVAIVAVVLIAIPAGMMQQRIRKRSEDHDPEARQAALDFQQDIDRGRAGF